MKTFSSATGLYPHFLSFLLRLLLPVSSSFSFSSLARPSISKYNCCYGEFMQKREIARIDKLINIYEESTMCSEWKIMSRHIKNCHTALIASWEERIKSKVVFCFVLSKVVQKLIKARKKIIHDQENRQACYTATRHEEGKVVRTVVNIINKYN